MQRLARTVRFDTLKNRIFLAKNKEAGRKVVRHLPAHGDCSKAPGFRRQKKPRFMLTVLGPRVVETRENDILIL